MRRTGPARSRQRPGDVLVVSGLLAEVTVMVQRLHEPAVVLHWRQRGGTVSGVLMRAAVDRLALIVP